MFIDSIIELLELGVIINKKKIFYFGKIVISFVIGICQFYDLIDSNFYIEFYLSSYVNKFINIVKNDNMVVINSVFEVDLIGQVVVDLLGYDFYSGIGG